MFARGYARRLLPCLILILSLLSAAAHAEDVSSPVPRIAHAGGGFKTQSGEHSLTNSIDALNANANKYDLFEIDLQWTADGRLVCVHDWENAALSAFGNAFEHVPDHAGFEKMVAAQAEYKNCTAVSLMAWLEAHPAKKIVTDVKDENVKALALLAKEYPGMRRQIIPQIYNPSEYQPVKDLGYEEIIFTLYRYKGSQAQAAKDAAEMDLYAVTVSKKKIKTKFEHVLSDWGMFKRHPKLVRDLSAIKIPVYVHTVNDAAELDSFQSVGVSEIYTDWLAPQGN